MSRHARLLPLILWPAALVLVGGCFFEPREPEPPATQSINYLPRTIVANIWENCRLALINKDSGGWDTAIAPNFQYVPDSDTEGAYPGVDWANWGKDSELGFINSWFATNISIEADLLNGGENDVTPDGSGTLAEWEVTYFITVTDEQTQSTTRYRGLCTLRFELQGNYWYLAYWRDDLGQQDPDNPGSTLETLGRVRGAFAP